MGDSEDQFHLLRVPVSITSYETPKKRKRENGVVAKVAATESLPSETPHKDRAGNTEEMEYGDLSQCRRFVMEEISDFVPEITPDQFMAHLVPNNKDVNNHMDLIYDTVLLDGLIKGGDWIDLNNTKTEARELEGYSHLEHRICDIGQNFLGRKSLVKHYKDGLSIVPDVWRFNYPYFQAFLIKECKVEESDADKYDVSLEHTHSLNEAHFATELGKNNLQRI